MGKFIPVDPDRWAELVKAAGERDALVQDNARLRSELTDLKYASDGFKAEVERWESENKLKAVRIKAQILDRLVELKKENSRFCLLFANSERDNASLKAEVERLTKENAPATARHLIASQDIKTLREQIASLCLERIAQRPTNDFTAFMVKLKDEHININDLNAAKSPTPLP